MAGLKPQFTTVGEQSITSASKHIGDVSVFTLENSKQGKATDTILGLQSEVPSLQASAHPSRANLAHVESFGKIDGGK